MEDKMKKILNFIVFVTAVSLSLSVFAAEKMKEATVEYSGDMDYPFQQFMDSKLLPLWQKILKSLNICLMGLSAI